MLTNEMRAGPQPKEPARHDSLPVKSAEPIVTVTRGVGR
jgi:hypothetical protein